MVTEDLHDGEGLDIHKLKPLSGTEIESSDALTCPSCKTNQKLLYVCDINSWVSANDIYPV